MSRARHLVVMAAGTGGHVIPGIAVAHEMMARGWTVSWLGTTHGMENRLVPPTGIPLDTIAFSGLRGKGLLHTATGGLRLLEAFVDCLRILRRRGARAVLGMGGYVCFPGGLMASLLNRHLQDDRLQDDFPRARPQPYALEGLLQEAAQAARLLSEAHPVTGQLEGVVLAKGAAHWVTTGLPLTLLAPVLGVLLNLAPDGYLWLVVSLALGTPALSVIGTFGAAVTVGLRRGGLLLSLLVLPMYVPTLIFGAEVVRRGAEGMALGTPLLMLGGITAGAFALLPFATGAVLRVNLR